MDAAPVLLQRQGNAAWIRFNRPPLNLFVPELVETVRDMFRALAPDPEVRVAVLCGSGRAFSAGFDLRFLKRLGVVSARELITQLHEAIASVYEAPFPVIAMIHGHCLGAAFELALACDLKTAAADARLGVPEVKLGIPSVIEAALLPLSAGPTRAAELLLTGETIPAEQARDWGLVNRVVPEADLEAATAELVEHILACGPSAVRAQKELIKRWRQTDLRSAIELGIAAFAASFANDEPDRRITAFLEKRGRSER